MDLIYDSISTQFSYIAPKLTGENWSFAGTSNTKTFDSSYTQVSPDTPYEFVDKERIIMSRSNEFANPIGGIAGTSSLVVNTYMVSANSKISPYVDRIRNNVTLTRNIVNHILNTSGYILNIANSVGTFNVGDTVWQNTVSSSGSTVANSYGLVLGANSSSIVIGSVLSSNQYNVSTFNANGTSIITDSNTSATANVTSVVYFSEDLGNGPEATRYISKNVVLDTGQDAEDLITYLGAYRPPGTNLYVYAKCIAAADGDAFNNKAWSAMPETSSPALLSSLINREDYVELTYDLPQSTKLYANNGTVSSNTVVSVPATGSTSQFTAGQYIYVAEGTTGNGFNVRQVLSIPNTTSLIVASNVTFTSSNAVIGIIPGLNTQTAVFKYDGNYNIARYSTSSDSIYDYVKTFAIKVVLTSNTSQVVPRMTDMRTIAMQA